MTGNGGAGGGNGGDAGGGLSRFAMVFAFVFVLFIMFNEDLRATTGEIVGVVFTPLIGFDHQYPVWTLFFAGITMVVLSTALRHFFIDWVEMARVQEVMRTFQREFKEARVNNNTYKVKRLTDMQPDIMKLQAELSGGQMKPMAFTMLVVIPIFAWLLGFVDPNPAAACEFAASMPWNDHWCLDKQWWFLPRWILLYSLFSVPFGQVTQRVLKLWEFRQAAESLDAAGAGGE